ncbi:hypothetical protein M413DRAFT_373153 [Hebeloma cylindrosporum]|uniref:Uncharacterized protein n=1 Tax=Hebeloma cylindrosporum TaxID=76867 RepID=A0A0C2Y2D2_HEBCY|nr:hypothetical protein M413DRAFT_373153 [Hebeloma cylindrosporum h7]
MLQSKNICFCGEITVSRFLSSYSRHRIQLTTSPPLLQIEGCNSLIEINGAPFPFHLRRALLHDQQSME